MRALERIDYNPWKVYTCVKQKVGAGPVFIGEMEKGQFDSSDNELSRKRAGY